VYPGANIHIDFGLDFTFLKESLLFDLFVWIFDLEEDMGTSEPVGVLSRVNISIGYIMGSGEIFAAYTYYGYESAEGDEESYAGVCVGMRIWLC
jgi:hypothetical protein